MKKLISNISRELRLSEFREKDILPAAILLSYDIKNKCLQGCKTNQRQIKKLKLTFEHC